MKDGKVISYMTNIFDKKTFKIESPDFKVVEASEFSKPVILGSGSSAINNLQKMVKDISNFGGFGNLDSRALILSGRLKEEAEKLDINSVGGQFQIVEMIKYIYREKSSRI